MKYFKTMILDLLSSSNDTHSTVVLSQAQQLTQSALNPQ